MSPATAGSPSSWFLGAAGSEKCELATPLKVYKKCTRFALKLGTPCFPQDNPLKTMAKINVLKFLVLPHFLVWTC